MAFTELSGSFGYIWYPGPDDIGDFEDALSWVLYVTHHGGVQLAQLPRRTRAGSGNPA